MLRLVIFLLLIAPPVAGGPWMRAPGHGFVSISTEVPLSPDATRWTYNAAYAEYGLTPRLAIGLDMGMNAADGTHRDDPVTAQVSQCPQIGAIVDAVWRVRVRFGLGQQSAKTGKRY